MDQLAKDLHFALRMIRKNPGFALVAALTLALGIGANTAIFSFVDAVLLRPLPYSHPERIVMVWEKPPDGDRNVISTLNFLDWKRQNTVFAAMAAETGGSVTLTGGDRPVQIQGARVSAPYFEIFGVKPMLGRTFAPDEDQPGKNLVAVLSHRLWESRFGTDPNIIGRTLVFNQKPYTVIGVMPPRTPFDRSWAQLWIPLAFEPKDMTRDYHWFVSYARIKPGVTLEQARAQMKSIAARIEHDYPQSNKGWSATVDRYSDIVVDKDLRRSLLVLFAAVGAVLLIGCVNLANLLLVRGAGREREVAVRSALGAGRGRLIRQFLTESVVLAGLGGAAGVGLGWGLMRALRAVIPLGALPAEANVRLDGRVLLFTALIVIATGILFGIAPAFHAARADLVGSLKEGGRGATTGAARTRVRDVLVVAEIALAFVLLSGSALLVRTLYRLQQLDLGFDSTNVITVWIPMTSADYPDGPHIIRYLGQVLDKLDAVPGVRAAATTSELPLEGWNEGMPFLIQGHPFIDMAKRPAANYKRVSPSYLATLQLRLLKGRWLAETDTAGNLPAIVINQPMAERYFKNEDPIGKRILIQQIIPGQPALGPEIPWEVVGVVADEKTNGQGEANPTVYVSYKQSPTTNTALVIRGAMNPERLQKSIQSAIWELNKNQSVDGFKTLDQLKSEALGDNRLMAQLLGAFAGVALLLAAIGIYGVVSYSVEQRTHEMGVRAALGATRWDQLRLVFQSGMSLAAIGLGAGVLGALGLTRLLASFLYGVSPRDPSTLALVTVVLAAVSAAACFIPARRATRVDPIVALRHE